MLLRSDGALVLWGSNTYGQATLPTIPPGTSIVDFEANGQTSGIKLSNGTWMLFGRNNTGQCNAPIPPPGTNYTKMSFGYYHTIALRSDGEVVGFGGAGIGPPSLTAVPPLPPGTTYLDCAAGRTHNVALRSDGVLVAWGGNTVGQCDVPTLPASVTCRQISCGDLHTAILLSDGRVLTWGDELFSASGIPILPTAATPFTVRHADASMALENGIVIYSDGRAAGWGRTTGSSIPLLPPGVRHRRADANYYHMVSLGTDGRLYGWGDNSYGQCNLPIPPAGVSYVDFGLGFLHTIGIRSDGQAVGAGSNNFGQLNFPALPTGVQYVKVASDANKAALLRSDGQIVITGAGFSPTAIQIPPLPPGLKYVDVALGDGQGFGAIRSDGVGLEWGFSPASSGYITGVPPLPTGVSYVEVSCGNLSCAWRRSDGQVVTSGYSLGGYSFLAAVRPLDPGTTYLGIQVRDGVTIARVGPASTYVSYASGCAGSRPSTRLIPRDTPAIGRELEVRLFDLPQDIAILAMGMQAASPLDLGFLGMPGCTWRTNLDATAALVGSNQQAVWKLPIPGISSLVGIHFFHQAIVLDSAAANAAGLVVSDAAEGVIGYP
jgi:hypothetical protein